MPLDESDRFTSGDFSPVDFVDYRASFFNTDWMLLAMMQALSLLTDPDNWNTVGDLSPEDCASLAVSMLELFEPLE